MYCMVAFYFGTKTVAMDWTRRYVRRYGLEINKQAVNKQDGRAQAGKQSGLLFIQRLSKQARCI
mgnify:CR=1 FL=1